MYKTKIKIIAGTGSYCRMSEKPSGIFQKGQARFRRSAETKKTKIKFTFGSVNLGFVVLLFSLLAGAVYIYSINSSAVQGYNIKEVEKEINELKNEQEQLKIREAELKSLYNIEAETKKINMIEPTNVAYIEEKGPLALK